MDPVSMCVITLAVCFLIVAIPEWAVQRLERKFDSETAAREVAALQDAERIKQHCPHGKKRRVDCGLCAFGEEAERDAAPGLNGCEEGHRITDVNRPGVCPICVPEEPASVKFTFAIPQEPRPWSLWFDQGLDTRGGELSLRLTSGASHIQNDVQVAAVVDLPRDNGTVIRMTQQLGSYALQASTVLYVPVRSYGTIRGLIISDRQGIDVAELVLNGTMLASGTVRVLEEVYRR